MLGGLIGWVPFQRFPILIWVLIGLETLGLLLGTLGVVLASAARGRLAMPVSGVVLNAFLLAITLLLCWQTGPAGEEMPVGIIGWREIPSQDFQSPTAPAPNREANGATPEISQLGGEVSVEGYLEVEIKVGPPTEGRPVVYDFPILVCRDVRYELVFSDNTVLEGIEEVPEAYSFGNPQFRYVRFQIGALYRASGKLLERDASGLEPRSSASKKLEVLRLELVKPSTGEGDGVMEAIPR